MKEKKMKRILAAVLVLLAATSVFAAEEKKSDNIIKKIFETAVSPLETISKATYEDKSAKDLGEIVVTPSGAEESAFDYPANVSVITRKQIESSNARFVYELLRHEPGIFVVDQTHTGKAVTVDMRGFGDTAARNVLVMMDGRRLNEIDISGPDWAQIPVENVERIEIMRGSGSVLYGDNASAGVINIITKKGQGAPTLKYNYETGSYRLNKQLVSAQGGYPFMKYNLLGKFEDTDGYRLNGYFQGYDFDANTTLNPADYLSMNIATGYHKDWYGMPAGLSRNEIDQLGRSGSTTPYDWAKTETGYLQFSPKLDLKTGIEVNSLEADMWIRKRRTTSETNSDWGSGLIPTRQSSQIDNAGGTFRYRIGGNMGPINNETLCGIDIYQAGNRMLSVTPSAPSWASRYDQLRITKDTLGLFISDKLIIAKDLIINGGYRYEWAKYIFDQQDDVNIYDEKIPSDRAIEIGAEYKFIEKGSFYGRFSRSYRFPATDEFFSIYTGLDTNIKQQVTETWEVGLKEETIKYIMAKLNFFIMNVKNEIFFDPMGGGGMGSNGVYDRVQRQGLELSLKSDINKHLSMYFNYTFLNAYFKDGTFAGNKVPMVPANKVNWGILVTPLEFLEIHFWSDYVGIQYPINDQYNRQPKLKDFFVCNTKATVKYKGWEIFAGINNIFNQKYSELSVASADGKSLDFYPAPEINWRFGAGVKF